MDFQLEQLINHLAGRWPALDMGMRWLAGYAEYAFIAIVAGLYFSGLVRREQRQRVAAVSAGFAAALALGINQFFLLVWRRPRPFVAHPALVHQLLSKNPDPSFPSDHAAASAAIAFAVLAYFRLPGVAVLVLALALDLARVFTGLHYPGDILAGVAVGAGAAALVVLRPERQWISRLDSWALAKLRRRA